MPSTRATECQECLRGSKEICETGVEQVGGKPLDTTVEEPAADQVQPCRQGNSTGPSSKVECCRRGFEQESEIMRLRFHQNFPTAVLRIGNGDKLEAEG